MIEVSLETFLRTGVFGPLEFGTSREEVESLLGPCERVIETLERDYRHDFLEYPEVAFSFLPVEAGLTGVRLRQSPDDSLEYYPGPPKIFEGRMQLDPWVIRWMTPRLAVEEKLSSARLPIWRLDSPIPDLIEFIEVGQGGTVLGFDVIGEFPGLSVIYNGRGPHAWSFPEMSRVRLESTS